MFHNPDGSALAVNQDGSVNSPTNRAEAGSIVTIWATGTGNLSVTAGEITTTANNSCNSDCQINVYGSVPGPSDAILGNQSYRDSKGSSRAG